MMNFPHFAIKPYRDINLRKLKGTWWKMIFMWEGCENNLSENFIDSLCCMWQSGKVSTGSESFNQNSSNFVVMTFDELLSWSTTDFVSVIVWGPKLICRSINYAQNVRQKECHAGWLDIVSNSRVNHCSFSLFKYNSGGTENFLKFKL